MKIKIRTYMVPVLLSVVAFIVFLLHFNNQDTSLLQNIPIHFIRIIALIYAIVTAISLPKEKSERSFWVVTGAYLFLDLVNRILLNIFLQSLIDNVGLQYYLNSWQYMLTITLELIALFLFIYGLFKLIKFLGIALKRKEIVIPKWIGISLIAVTIICCVILALLFPMNVMVIIVYFAFGIYLSLLIPISIILCRSKPSGKLKTPIFLVTLSVSVLALKLVFLAINSLVSFVKQPFPPVLAGLNTVTLHILSVLPFLFVLLLMMSLASRIEIAKQEEENVPE